jgi:hypothetical protein
MDEVARHRADIGSDHSPVFSKLKKLRKVNKKNQRDIPQEIQKLKDPNTKRNFQLEARNRFSALMEQDDVQLDCFNTILLDRKTASS